MTLEGCADGTSRDCCDLFCRHYCDKHVYKLIAHSPQFPRSKSKTDRTKINDSVAAVKQHANFGSSQFSGVSPEKAEIHV